jgi:hypothetical protein
MITFPMSVLVIRFLNLNDDGSGTMESQSIATLIVFDMSAIICIFILHSKYGHRKNRQTIWNCFKNNFETVCDSLPATYIFALPF